MDDGWMTDGSLALFERGRQCRVGQMTVACLPVNTLRAACAIAELPEAAV
jgi:hypothetical protein